MPIKMCVEALGSHIDLHEKCRHEDVEVLEEAIIVSSGIDWNAAKVPLAMLTCTKCGHVQFYAVVKVRGSAELPNQVGNPEVMASRRPEPEVIRDSLLQGSRFEATSSSHDSRDEYDDDDEEIPLLEDDPNAILNLRNMAREAAREAEREAARQAEIDELPDASEDNYDDGHKCSGFQAPKKRGRPKGSTTKSRAVEDDDPDDEPPKVIRRQPAEGLKVLNDQRPSVPPPMGVAPGMNSFEGSKAEAARQREEAIKRLSSELHEGDEP
jgi:hypothetical protein